jgi:hypothetical protein
MKIDNETIEILKNFSQINNQIYVKKGNVIRSMERGKTILAESKLPFTFDIDFAIYDLNKFLLTINLFKNPELIFEEKFVKICDERKSIDYFYANPETLDDSTVKALNNVKETEILDKISISYETLVNVKNISSTLDLECLMIEADGKNISFHMNKNNNQSAGNYKEIIGPTDKTYKIVANKIKHKMLKDDYEMIIFDTAITKLAGNKVSYWIPGEFN